MPEDSPTTFDFEPLAADYDQWYQTAEGTMYDRLEKRAVTRLLPRSGYGRRLLEVGCGTGHWTRLFSDRGFEVTGVDISASMLGVSRKKEIGRASFGVADAHSLPFADGQFEVSVAITTLEFVRDPGVVVGEMARCARKPGGIVLVGVLNAWGRRNRRMKAAGEPPYGAARLVSPREMKAMLTPYGGTKVAVAAFVPNAAWLLPLAPIVDLVGRLLRLPWGDFVIGRVVL